MVEMFYTAPSCKETIEIRPNHTKLARSLWTVLVSKWSAVVLVGSSASPGKEGIHENIFSAPSLELFLIIKIMSVCLSVLWAQIPSTYYSNGPEYSVKIEDFNICQGDVLEKYAGSDLVSPIWSYRTVKCFL